MASLQFLKRAVVALGLYRPSRWVIRRLRPDQQRAFDADVALYRALLPPRALCFDIGANVGEKSEAMLRAGGRVVAFEPNPEVHEELQARCGHDPGWTLIRAAVGRVSGTAPFYARLAAVNSGMLEGGDTVAVHEVMVTTLNDAVSAYGSPQFCKIDVEGWEQEVIEGLTTAIPLIAFEFQLHPQGVSRTLACLRHLATLGAGRVNFTPAESTEFLFPEWMPLEQAATWFPGDLRETLPGDLYGDVYVKLAPS